MDPKDFFISPANALHKQYEALRAFFIEDKTTKQVANQFGYTESSVYSLVRDFKQELKSGNPEKRFFLEVKRGRKKIGAEDEIVCLIILLRKKFLSVPDIKSILDAQNYSVSEKFIYDVLKKEGFARLPRRDKKTHLETLSDAPLTAPKTFLLSNDRETVYSSMAGI